MGESVASHTAAAAGKCRVLSPRSRQTLFTLPAFRGFGEAERDRIASLFTEVARAKGETIYEEGDAADALYVVVSCAVDVVDQARSITRYGPGEVFGEAVLIPGESRAVTTRVALDATLLVLPRSSVIRLLELHPCLHERVAAVLARRLKAAAHTQTVKGTRPAEIVVLEGWRSNDDRRAFVQAAAGAIENELGRPVAIVTVAPPGAAPTITVRGHRPDSVVVGDARAGGALRER